MDRAAIEAEVRQALVRLAEFFGTAVPNPAILWNLKGVSAIGTASADRTIRLHPEAFEKLGDEYLSTALHEACHIAVSRAMRERGVWQRTGVWTPHGVQWRKAMLHLGQSPDRTATMPEGVSLTPARKTQRFVVACSCRTHVIGAQRAQSLGRYHCRACGSSLRIVSEVAA